MNSKHAYQGIYKISRFLGYAMGLFFFVFGLLFLGNLIVSLIQGKPISVLNSIEMFLGFSVILPLLFLFADFLEADIDVDESGLNLKTSLKTFYIKWEDVVEIRKASLFGIPMFNKPNIVITKCRLSPFHYLYGLVYARTFQPSFFFSKFITDSDSLRQEIIDGIKKTRLAKQYKTKKAK
jgi:hypothetical protein